MIGEKKTVERDLRDALLKYRDTFGVQKTLLLLMHLFAECKELKEK